MQPPGRPYGLPGGFLYSFAFFYKIFMQFSPQIIGLSN